MVTCWGCVHYKKSIYDWPCRECSRKSDGDTDHYQLPGEKGKPVVTIDKGRWKLVDKGDHYETERV